MCGNDFHSKSQKIEILYVAVTRCKFKIMSFIMMIKGTTTSELTKALEVYMPNVVSLLAKEYSFDAEAGMKLLGEFRVKNNCDPISMKTKNAGAGGANTNKNGLPYEELTDLCTEYRVHNSNQNSSTVTFNSHPEIEFTSTRQSNFIRTMNEIDPDALDKTIKPAHGCKNPDECYIHRPTKTLVIIEKKFQMVGGSVCEKIQTPDFKIWQFNRTFPEYKIVYTYCLSSWFKENCQAELEYLEYKQIQVFWGNSPTYKNDIIQYIISQINVLE